MIQRGTLVADGSDWLGAADDQHMARQAAQCLSGSAYAPVRCVRCSVKAGVLTLSGRVPSFYLKQVAQSLVLKLGQFEGVINHLDVPHEPVSSQE